jgi:Suppressor of fused protein (SUFU)
MSADQTHATIVRHMEQRFGAVQDFCVQDIVPGQNITVHIIPAGTDRNFVTLFTAGMSDRPMNVLTGHEEYQFAELFILLPPSWPTTREAIADETTAWPYRWLGRIAAYPFEQDTWLRGPYAIFPNGDPPEPLAPNTRLSCLLVLEDLSAGGRFQDEDGRSIMFYAVYPIYTEERDVERQSGVLELLSRFLSDQTLKIVDLERRNLANLPS